MKYIKNKELIEKLEIENTLFKVKSIEKIAIDNRWISMYDLISLFCLLGGFSTKIHNFHDVFEELFLDFIKDSENIKFYERHDYFHLIEINGEAEEIFSELITDEDGDGEYWDRYDWRDKGISKDEAFSFLNEIKNKKIFYEFKVLDTDLLIKENLDDHFSFIKINDVDIKGEYLEDLHNKIENLTAINSQEIESATPSMNINDEILIEINGYKESIKRLEHKYSDLKKISGNVSDSGMAKKAISKLIGALIKKSYPALTKEKGLAAHGLIEAVARETNVDSSVIRKWIEIAQHYEMK